VMRLVIFQLFVHKSKYFYLAMFVYGKS
jgi:hypothetical protein